MSKRDVESHFLTDVETLNQATEIYSRWGLNLSDAINMFLAKSVEAEGFPFDRQPRALSYEQLSEIAYKAPINSDGVPILPAEWDDCDERYMPTEEDCLAGQENSDCEAGRRTAQELIEAINEKLGRLEKNPSTKRNPFEAIGGDADRYAALVLSETEKQAGPYSEAEALLLSSLLRLLDNWFRSDSNPQSVALLLGLTNAKEAGNDFWSPLDLIFDEIKTGTYYKANPDFEEGSDRPRLLHLVSRMIRKSAEDPSEIDCGKHKGFDVEEDDSLRFYSCFKALPAQEQSNAITTLSYRFINMESKAKA